MLRTVVAAGLAALIGLGSAAQDEAPKAAKYANVKWYEISHVAYHPTKRDDALTILYDHFFPAAQTAGIPIPRVLEYATGGQWDIAVIYPLPDGPGYLEWELSPEGAKWIRALTERLGGPSATTVRSMTSPFL